MRGQSVSQRLGGHQPRRQKSIMSPGDRLRGLKDAPSVSFKLNHARRRQAALELQRTRRAAVVEQFRRDSKSLEDLDLDSSSSDEEPAGPSNRLHPVFGTAAPSDPPLVSQGSRAKQKKGKKAKDKYSKFANLLAWGEYLSAEQPPPEDILSPPPSLSAEPSSFLAKRNIGVVTCHNTVLLSRSSGRPICRALTACPPGCLLDCVLDLEQQCLWALDVLEWASTTLTESEALFRFWWLGSKIDELGLQPFQFDPSSGNTKSRVRRLVLVQVPPFNSHDVGLLSQAQAGAPQTVPVSVLQIGQQQSPQAASLNLKLTVEGVMLYHSASYYIMQREQHHQFGLSSRTTGDSAVDDQCGVEVEGAPLCYWVPSPSTVVQGIVNSSMLCSAITGYRDGLTGTSEASMEDG